MNGNMDLQNFILWTPQQGRTVQVSTNKAPFGAFKDAEIATVGTSHALSLGVPLSGLMSPH